MIGNNRTTIRLPPNIEKDINRAIKKRGITKSDLIRFAISDYLYGETVKE
jgi:Arc/MetJ-type ribon-helix-helix transcriptional regulator